MRTWSFRNSYGVLANDASSQTLLALSHIPIKKHPKDRDLFGRGYRSVPHMYPCTLTSPDITIDIRIKGLNKGLQFMLSAVRYFRHSRRTFASAP